MSANHYFKVMFCRIYSLSPFAKLKKKVGCICFCNFHKKQLNSASEY